MLSSCYYVTSKVFTLSRKKKISREEIQEEYEGDDEVDNKIENIDEQVTQLIKPFENRIVRDSEIRMDLECSSPIFSKCASCKNAKKLRKNQCTFSGVTF